MWKILRRLRPSLEARTVAAVAVFFAAVGFLTFFERGEAQVTGACPANQFVSVVNNNIPTAACSQPSFANLSGTVPVAQGGTGLTSGTSGGIPFFSSSTAMGSSAVLPANGVVFGGGAATTPYSAVLAHTAFTISPGAGTVSSSSGGVMAGLNGNITPALGTTTVQLRICGNAANNQVGSGVGTKVQLRYGTGTAPSNGASLAGTTRGNMLAVSSSAANTQYAFCVGYPVTGQAAGVALWFDVSFQAQGGGESTLYNTDLVADELP